MAKGLLFQWISLLQVEPDALLLNEKTLTVILYLW
jgi:hypothetical protein